MDLQGRHMLQWERDKLAHRPYLQASAHPSRSSHRVQDIHVHAATVEARVEAAVQRQRGLVDAVQTPGHRHRVQGHALGELHLSRELMWEWEGRNVAAAGQH